MHDKIAWFWYMVDVWFFGLNRWWWNKVFIWDVELGFRWGVELGFKWGVDGQPVQNEKITQHAKKLVPGARTQDPWVIRGGSNQRASWPIHKLYASSKINIKISLVFPFSKQYAKKSVLGARTRDLTNAVKESYQLSCWSIQNILRFHKIIY